MTDAWRPVGKVPPKQLGSARLQAHNAAQWVARLANSYIEPEPGDRHLDLAVDASDGALLSRDIGGGLCVGLDVADLALQFRENGRRSPHRLDMDARTPSEVEAWFLVELLHRLRDRDRFYKALPFEIAGLMTGDSADFLREQHAEGLAELAAWQANAAATLRKLAKGKAPLISSPLHFDIAVVIPVEGRRDASVRAGFAPGDERLPEPYFYVSDGATLGLAPQAGVARIGRSATRDLVVEALPVSDLAPGASGAAQALAFLEAGVTGRLRRQAN
jgi:hypothetical protein